ncbi:DUF4238 domain-containing protein [Pseudomonas saponiphila]|uniref:DUF4238 domain-containing protein n=1 Tax=Pseudomonas saponiphila TaxID=556534 RepID=UPI0022402B6C|nr:DUF4238 domain-containing protein [Pseudomonas saponiphila]
MINTVAKVPYKRNQHVLSQWILRNFRSDDTATEKKDKQRVWCHTVYLDDDKENEITLIPLPISSVAVSKDCFMLIDGGSGEKFDIEAELSEYEFRTSSFFNKLIHENKFELLVDVKNNTCEALDTILNFMVVQMILNAHNPQNKSQDKDIVFDSLIELVLGKLTELMGAIDNPPDKFKYISDSGIYKKIKRVFRSSSDDVEKAKALVVLFLLAESSGLPIPFGMLSGIRNELFQGLYIDGIYHTGYGFDSTELRPVFSIGPNVFSYYMSRENIYLPIAHNYAINFSVGGDGSYNKSIDVYSVNPSLLKCKSSAQLKVFQVSHDYIDSVTSIVATGNIALSNTIYTPFELKNVHDYLGLQRADYSKYHYPDEPRLTT